MQALKLAFRNVLRNRHRSLITIIIATVGTACILISGGFGLYTYDSLRQSAARDTGHITLSHANYFTQEEETTLELGLQNYRDIQKSLSTDLDIRAALPRVNFSGLISNGDKSTIFMGSGVDAEEFTVKGPFLSVVAGKTLSRNPDADNDPEVMLGEGLASNLKAEPGSILTLLSTTSEGALNAIDVEVRGIFSAGVPELSKRLIYTHINTAQELIDSQKVSTLSVYLYKTEHTERYQIQLQNDYPDLAHTPWWERAFYYFKVRDIYNRIFGILGTVITLLVFFSVSNTLTMSVVERTREIGTLAAIGCYPREIIRNFVLEALIIAVIGSLLGIVITAVTTVSLFLADVQMPPPPGRTASYPLHIYFSTELAIITAGALILICCTAAWFAARKGANRPIVEALTHV